MIEVVNSALLSMQRALAARSLYSPTHPAVRTSEAEACARLAEALAGAGDVKLVAVHDRVLWNDKPLPASKALSRELFLALREAGVDRVTFRRGLEAAEVETLLDAIVASKPLRSLKTCPHVCFGHISRDVVDAEMAQLLLGSCAQGLEDVHRTIWTERRLPGDVLDDMVAAIGTVVSDYNEVLIPLLKTKRHDEYTFVHTTNVAVLSAALAEALGFPQDVIRNVTVAALLHDVGKQAIPEEILNRQGRLTEEELRIVQMHPVIGARMLLDTPRVPDLAPIVAYEHHVRSDGGGYPRTTPDWKLNLASRIVQMTDVFDALRTHRPYRAALAVPKIKEIMRNDYGTESDAWLLNLLFQDVVDRGVLEPGAAAVPASG